MKWCFRIFTYRNPNDNMDELRMGFVIVDPNERGKGYGKAMLQLGLKYAFEIYGAKKYRWAFLKIMLRHIIVTKLLVLMM